MKINLSESAAANGVTKGDQVVTRVAKNEWYTGVCRKAGAKSMVIEFDDGYEATVEPADFKHVHLMIGKKSKKPLTDAAAKALIAVEEKPAPRKAAKETAADRAKRNEQTMDKVEKAAKRASGTKDAPKAKVKDLKPEPKVKKDLSDNENKKVKGGTWVKPAAYDAGSFPIIEGYTAYWMNRGVEEHGVVFDTVRRGWFANGPTYKIRHATMPTKYWKIPIRHITKLFKPDNLGEVIQGLRAKDIAREDKLRQFRSGQDITVTHRRIGNKVPGVVIKVNQKTVSVMLNGKIWKVPPTFID